jgi:hypothetical protein
MQSEGTTIARVVSGNRVTTTREELVVRVVTLEGSAKWKFNWKGQVISAKISDEVFLERVRKSSERFGAGDRLDVELVTTQKFDEATQDYLNASYEISCVWRHDKMPSQRDLFAEDEN